MGDPGKGRLLVDEMSQLLIAPPSAEVQLAFLAKIQRLFTEGEFTATYKFALVIALSDLAVECGREDGGKQRIAYSEIAEKFIELYWSHTLPYARASSGALPMMLVQSHGTQAAVVTAIDQFKQTTKIKNLTLAHRNPTYTQLQQQIARTISAQPAQYLQNLGGTTDPFIFERIRGGVELMPGVSFCLRQFQPLIQQFARQRWVQHIKANRLNAPALGSDDDLAAFLFAASRQSLDVVRNGLKKLANRKCFYCGETVSQEGEVDHFIPFSSYPRDLMHNFVYADAKCNRAKSDALAAHQHLERWLEFSERESDGLMEIGQNAGIAGDWAASIAVAGWSYRNARRSGARAWIERREYEAVSLKYLSALSLGVQP